MRREHQPTPVFLSGKSHGQRKPTGYSPWGHRESDTSESFTLYFKYGNNAYKALPKKLLMFYGLQVPKITASHRSLLSRPGNLTNIGDLKKKVMPTLWFYRQNLMKIEVLGLVF